MNTSSIMQNHECNSALPQSFQPVPPGDSVPRVRRLATGYYLITEVHVCTKTFCVVTGFH